MIDSPGKVPSFESEAVDRIHEELCLHSRPSSLAYPARNALAPEEAFSYDILLQTAFIEQLGSPRAA